MNIGKKFLINSMLVIFSLLLVGGVSFYFTNKVAQVSGSLFETQAVPNLKLGELESTTWKILLQTILHTGVQEQEDIERIEREIKKLNILFIKQRIAYENVAFPAGSQDSAKLETKNQPSTNMKDFVKKWEIINQMSMQVVDLSKNFAKEDAVALILGERLTAFNEVQALFGKRYEHHRKQMDILSNDAVSSRETALQAIIFLTLLGRG